MLGRAEHLKSQAEHVINVTPGGPCHHYGEGAPLKQINTRACGKYCQTKSCIEQAPELSQDDSQWQITERKENVNRMEDQYLKAWKEWVERDRLEKIEHTERLGKQERLSRRWDMIRSCREIIVENYSDWQERKITEDEKKEIQDLEDEKQQRLETGRSKKEEFKISKEMETKEQILKRKLEIAEIKENAWKWRSEKSSH